MEDMEKEMAEQEEEMKQQMAEMGLPAPEEKPIDGEQKTPED